MPAEPAPKIGNCMPAASAVPQALHKRLPEKLSKSTLQNSFCTRRKNFHNHFLPLISQQASFFFQLSIYFLWHSLRNGALPHCAAKKKN
ncbi:MAG: hypothetical protein D6816_18755 [Bacteroidetes bacterium]|nr:MAG: hypothetical protein D6816_18755 [Bacteroidota bacterium]